MYETVCIRLRVYTYRCNLTHLQQTTFENIVTTGDVAHNDQMFTKSSAADLMNIVKG